MLLMNCLLKHFIEGAIERTGRGRRIRMRRRKRKRRRKRRRRIRRGGGGKRCKGILVSLKNQEDTGN